MEISSLFRTFFSVSLSFPPPQSIIDFARKKKGKNEDRKFFISGTEAEVENTQPRKYFFFFEEDEDREMMT